MSPPRLNGHISNQITSLITSNNSFGKLVDRMISTAAKAEQARGKKTLFGFGRDQWPEANSYFEAASQDVLNYLVENGTFEGWGYRETGIYWVLNEILGGKISHPEIEVAKRYWGWVKAEFFDSSLTMKPGKFLISF